VRRLMRTSLWRWLRVGLALMPGAAALGAPLITEFMAIHDAGLVDEDGEFSDWIEIHNPEAVPISLAGYSLTDNAALTMLSETELILADCTTPEAE